MERLILNTVNYIKPLYVSQFVKKNPEKPFLWITTNELNHEQIKGFIKFFVPNINVISIPELDTKYSDLIKPDKALVLARIKAFYSILHNHNNHIVLANESVINETTISPIALNNLILNIKTGEDIGNITGKLSQIGYSREYEVTSVGEFAVRGDILDIFVDKPYRISLFGTTVEKIKEFDSFSKLTIESSLKSISVFPVTELLGESPFPIINFFSDKYIIFKDDECSLEFNSSEICNFSKFSDKNTSAKKIYLNYKDFNFDKIKSPIDYIKNIVSVNKSKKIIIAVQNSILAKRLSNILEVKIYNTYEEFVSPGICIFESPKSFTTDNFILLSSAEIFHDVKHRKTIKIRKEDLLKDINSLLEKDYVVHIDHGIGQFQKLTTLNISGKPHDFLEIIYDENEKLFLPVENIDLLSRYSSESAPAKLDKLGSKIWQKRKANIKSKISALSVELINIAALRNSIKVDPIIFDNDEFDRFCNDFEYIETSDQLKAVQEVVADLSSGKLMDRLVCGDVGFGKTEVAMRAAFLVSRTMQVCVVVPTTILSHQHFEAFQKRFNKFNTKIVELSRASNNKSIKQSIEDGTAQIIIATHSAFKQKFHNLGLLIIDEEQHFGVKQKEFLKASNKNLHLLTLTATPIPRTLQLSVSGIRDISLIATPPIERIAARIIIVEEEPHIIKEAIEREIHRGGQIFYTCPYISDITDVEKLIQIATPSATYAILHGKMSSAETEGIMHDFRENKYNILISTNIIESGVDIRNVNTIIVHNSHFFGLASLYQLKGRTGRSNLQAFAYFTIPIKKSIPKNAERRLNVIKQLENLGAGFSLSSYDMDIRGAGNILGEEQSGHIKEIGIELYQKMLKNALENSPELEDIRINMNIPVLIPDDYISDNNDRISYYQKISSSKTKEELFIIKSELKDLFGKLPSEVMNLLYIVDLKNKCRKLMIKSVESGPKGIMLSFAGTDRIDQILQTCRTSKGNIVIKPDNKVFLKKGVSLNDFFKQISVDN